MYLHAPYRKEEREFAANDGLCFAPVHDERTEKYKASIASGATLPPVEVEERHGRCVLRDGHHRATAWSELGLPIPAIVAVSLQPCKWKGRR